MNDVLIFCRICGDVMEPWDDRAEWDKRLAHTACVAEQDEALDPEWMEDMGYVE